MVFCILSQNNCPNCLYQCNIVQDPLIIIKEIFIFVISENSDKHVPILRQNSVGFGLRPHFLFFYLTFLEKYGRD